MFKLQLQHPLPRRRTFTVRDQADSKYVSYVGLDCKRAEFIGNKKEIHSLTRKHTKAQLYCTSISQRETTRHYNTLGTRFGSCTLTGKGEEKCLWGPAPLAEDMVSLQNSPSHSVSSRQNP